MQKSIQHLLVVLFAILLISSCEDEGDDWTLAKTVSLGDVSIRVPETYEYEISTSSRVELSNGAQGNSVAILKDPINGLTQDSIFNYRTIYYPYGTAISKDTTLLGRPTRKLETTIFVAPELGGEHTITSFIFLEDGYVYTLEYAWSKQYFDKSVNLMNNMLASLQIN